MHNVIHAWVDTLERLLFAVHGFRSHRVGPIQQVVRAGVAFVVGVLKAASEGLGGFIAHGDFPLGFAGYWFALVLPAGPGSSGLVRLVGLQFFPALLFEVAFSFPAG